MPLGAAVALNPRRDAPLFQPRHRTPARYGVEPLPGVLRWNGIDDPHDLTIENARGREPEFALDRNGFALIRRADCLRQAAGAGHGSLRSDSREGYPGRVYVTRRWTGTDSNSVPRCARTADRAAEV